MCFCLSSCLVCYLKQFNIQYAASVSPAQNVFNLSQFWFNVLLKSLHWLPGCQKMDFKIISVIYKSINVVRTEYIWFTFGLSLKNMFIKSDYSRFYSAEWWCHAHGYRLLYHSLLWNDNPARNPPFDGRVCNLITYIYTYTMVWGNTRFWLAASVSPSVSSEHHRMATVTHKLQKVHFPSKFTDTRIISHPVRCFRLRPQ